ncbi:hypothetical protein OIU78_019638 [Salix suchowensis]|nr:hypothetical protein OIU78_019638 [Salix suchowensis]
MATDKGKSPTNQTTKSQTNTWAAKVKIAEASTRFTLDPIPRCEEGVHPEITMDMLTDNAEQWTRCMVGFFPGFRMNYHTVNTIANRVWRSGGLEDVMSTTSGFWIFRFQTEDQMLAILERGPWMFGGKGIVLQQWHPQFVFDKNRISKLPVWIRIHGLPFNLWSRKGLSVVASRVGRPLSCDESTYCCTRLDYARVCIEVDAEIPYVHNFEIQSPLAVEPLHITVEYEWKPPRCGKCKLFGHVCKDSVAKVSIDATTLDPKPKPVMGKKPLGQTEKENGTTQSSSSQPPLNKTNPKAPKDSRPTTKDAQIVTKGSTTNEEELRVLKGKMKETEQPLCLVHEDATLHSHNATVSSEEEPSISTTRDVVANEDHQDSCAMEYTKVKRKKGGKKNREVVRL